MRVNNVYYRTMGRCYRVTAIFHSDRAANDYMLEHVHESVIATLGRQVFLADVRDEGIPVQSYLVPGPSGLRRVASIKGALFGAGILASNREYQAAQDGLNADMRATLESIALSSRPLIAVELEPEPMDIWDTCELCGRRQESCWPVAINDSDQNIRMLCDGCAARDLNSAWVIDMLERKRQ